MKDSYDETTILPCLILYPDKEAGEYNLPYGSLIEGAASISSYINFYKLVVLLPNMKQSPNGSYRHDENNDE